MNVDFDGSRTVLCFCREENQSEKLEWYIMPHRGRQRKICGRVMDGLFVALRASPCEGGESLVA